MLPCRVAPLSTVKTLVSGPVAIRVPPATSVAPTEDVPLRVTAPPRIFRSPAPVMVPASVRLVAVSIASVPASVRVVNTRPPLDVAPRSSTSSAAPPAMPTVG